MRTDILCRIHCGHLRIAHCKSRVTEHVFLPNLYNENSNLVCVLYITVVYVKKKN